MHVCFLSRSFVHFSFLFVINFAVIFLKISIIYKVALIVSIKLLCNCMHYIHEHSHATNQSMLYFMSVHNKVILDNNKK